MNSVKNCDYCGAPGVEIGKVCCEDCGPRLFEAWERADKSGARVLSFGVPVELDARHVRIKLQLFKRDELARRVDDLDAMIAAEVRDVAPPWMKPEDAMIAIRALKFDGREAELEAAMIARSGAALRALDEQSEAQIGGGECCPACGGTGEWQGDSHTRMFGGYSCAVCSGSGEAPDDELDPNEEARAAAFQAAERELAALDEPMEGETWRAFHERAALEIIAHYTSGGAEEDTRAELREAIDHIVKAADEAAAERGAATVKRVEELLAAHHVQLGRALEMTRRAAVQEALSILNTATGAAVNALTAQDPAVD